MWSFDTFGIDSNSSTIHDGHDDADTNDEDAMEFETFQNDQQ